MNKRKGMAIKAERSVELSASVRHVSNEERIARVGELQDVLAVCSTDILARSELATLLEQLAQPEEALFNWNAFLIYEPNSLIRGGSMPGTTVGGPCPRSGAILRT